QNRKYAAKTDDSSLYIPQPPSMAKPAAQTASPLIRASIGNPGATYANTLHSAGHIVTSALAEAKRYGPSRSMSAISKPPATHMAFGPNGIPASSDRQRAMDDWTSGNPHRRLVVCMMSLMSALGKVTIRDGAAASAKGMYG
ncbi:hypothetical protein BKA58DRAFT_395651, partial [Alternaria rosae]|uniref:uncharacterized protein n=1 Tax=Alternaria rosae TaxID=1187941 RepID=UPI001E8D752D